MPQESKAQVKLRLGALLEAWDAADMAGLAGALAEAGAGGGANSPASTSGAALIKTPIKPRRSRCIKVYPCKARPRRGCG
jgi:hypothetical protein